MSTKIKKPQFYTLKKDLVFKSIIVDDTDYTMMNNILSDILDREIKVKRYLNNELKIKKVKHQAKRGDIFLETEDNVIINVELNSNYDKGIKNRNYLYYSDLCSEALLRGKKYKEVKEVIQININFNQSKNIPLKEEYLLRNKEGKILTENFRIVNVNIARYKQLCYDKNIKGDKEHIYLTMLGTDKEEISKLAKKDKKIKEVEEKMLHLNEDGTITNTMTAEEDDEMVTELRRKYAYEAGMKDGAKVTARKNALSMIKKKYSLKEISEITKISLEDLKQLKRNI